MQDTEEDRNEYTTSLGVVLKLKPVSPFLIQKIQESIKLPDPPMYTAVTVGGSEERHPHDAESIKSASADEQAAWMRYSTESRAAMSAANDRVVRVILSRGVDSPELRLGWDREQEEMGIKVPTDPTDRKVHYLMTEAIGTADDLATLITRIMALTGIAPEVLASAMGTFRNSVRPSATAGTNGSGAVTLVA